MRLPTSSPHRRTAGPLVVSKANPRYFAIELDEEGSQRLVYLTGSHVNNNFQDGAGPAPDCADTPEQFDYDAYLIFLKDHGHNFIRLWRWEHIRSQVANGAFHLCMTPQPWLRTGPGVACDGKPKFDLFSHDEHYFERLRDRVVAACDNEIYVSLMLFDGFGLHLSQAPDNIEGHPFHASNNINGIGITSIIDYQVLPLDARVQAIQESYLRKVVDTVQGLPNILYEVANESSGTAADTVQLPDGSRIATPIGDSTLWQYWVINFVRQHERKKGHTVHPIGMTMQYPVSDRSKVNRPLYDSSADWISPGDDDPDSALAPDGSSRLANWLIDPPANDGRKIIISDTDHYSPMQSSALWVWKSFLRGHNPILYDLGIVNGVNPPDPTTGQPSYQSLESARVAMGEARRLAEQVNLAAMTPRGDLSSTGYALIEPGGEYLVLQDDEALTPFTLLLEPGSYSVTWYRIDSRQIRIVYNIGVERAEARVFTPPFEKAGAALLHLKCLRAETS